MNEDIEALVLSGKLFGNGTSRSSSPERSASPDSGWHDDELKHRRISPPLVRHNSGSDNDNEEDGDVSGRRIVSGARTYAAHRYQHQQQPPTQIGMGPGRTGVKGVIRDRNEAVERELERQRRETEDLRRRMEKSNLGGKTYLEEEREKARDPAYEGKIDELVLRERNTGVRAVGVGGRHERVVLDFRGGEKKDFWGRSVREGWFGHLREVGVEGFVGAVEEPGGVWVVVHLYEPSLERCEDLDDTLTELAQLYPSTKFLRARASALGFATSAASTSTATSTNTTRHRRNLSYDRYLHQTLSGIDEEKYSYYFDDKYPIDDEDVYDSEEEVKVEKKVDLDMLPTMLVYRDGNLVHNWVRVDWEAGTAGIQKLLEHHHIVPQGKNAGIKFTRDAKVPLDSDRDGDDDDVYEDPLWSDSDDEK